MVEHGETCEVRHTRAECEEHEVRRPDPHAMTQNKLLDRRKREYMERGALCCLIKELSGAFWSL